MKLADFEYETDNWLFGRRHIHFGQEALGWWVRRIGGGGVCVKRPHAREVVGSPPLPLSVNGKRNNFWVMMLLS